MKTSKRIGIDCRSGSISHSGIGMYINCLVNNLSNVNNKYYLICYNDFKINNKSIDFEYKVIKKTNKHFENQVILPSILYKLKLDVYHVTHHDFFPILYFKKTIISVMDIFWIDYKNDSSILFKLLFYLITIYSLIRSKTIITISEATKKSILHKFNINSSKIHPILISCHEDYSKLNSNEKLNDINPYILYVGSTAQRKNIEIFDKIDDYLKSKGFTINFLILTNITGKNDTNLAHLEKKKNFMIDYNDYSIEELNKFYNNSLVFLFPSLYEGFGLPVLEAMKSGTIPITSNRTSLPEIVKLKDLIFEPGDYKSISEKIIKIKCDNNYRNNLVKKLNEISLDFSWIKTSNKTEHLYEI